MSDITIRLVYNLNTGKKDVYIDLHSDADALVMEHEKDHRQVVEQLLGKGVLTPDDVGEVRVSRISPNPNTSEHQEEIGQQESIGNLSH